MVKLPRLFYLLPFLTLICMASPAGLLDVSKLVKTAKNVTIKSYPDAETVLLDERVVVQYQANGTYTSIDDFAYKILTDTGIRQNQCLDFDFDSAYDTVKIHLLQLIDEKGNVTQLPHQQLSSITTDNSNFKANIYDPLEKKLLLMVPNLRKNLILRCIVERSCTKTRMPNTFSYWENLEGFAPILHYQFEIIAPNQRPLKHHLLGSPVDKTATYRTKKLANGGVHHIWEATNVPQTFPEPKMPKAYTCTQRVMASTLDTWEEISRWNWKLCEPHMKVTDEIKAKVAQLTAKTPDDKTKIWNIFTFVSQEIRYMGETTETDAPGYEPHDVAQTFKKRHGVCRDKAALLVAMLRQAGFQAYPVLIHVGEQLDPKVPMLFFNHEIAAVYHNGQYQLMDPTNETTHSLLPEYLCNRSYLVARPEGDKLHISSVPPPDTNQFDAQTICFIHQDGLMTGRTLLLFKGLQDNQYRRFFAECSTEEIRMYLQRLLSGAVPGAQLLQYEQTPANAMDTTIPLKLELFYEVQHAMNGNDTTAFFRPPNFSRLGAIGKIFTGLHLTKRRFPYMTRYPLTEHQKTVIIVTPEWGFIQPPPQPENKVNSKLKWQKTVCLENNVLTLDETCSISAVQFTPSEYMGLKNTFDEMQNARVPILIQRNKKRKNSPKKPNVTLLEQKYDITLISSKSIKETIYIKKQILTYGGKQNLEITLPFLPDYEKATVDFARVYNNGRFQELNLNESKVMDAEWNGEAPRYPKGKILIANLPGVEIGSIIEYQITTQSKNLTHLNLMYMFQGESPILYNELTLRKPKQLKLSLHCSQNGLLSPNKPERIRQTWEMGKDGIEVYKWTAEGMDSIDLAPNTPRLRVFAPFVQASTNNRQQWLIELRTAIRTLSVSDQKIKEFIQGLDDMTPMQKLLAIRNHVDQNVRTAGPAFQQLPFTCLSPASVTFADCYGNAADKAILLNTLAKEAGFTPKIYLVNSHRQDEQTQEAMDKFFDPNNFDTVLVQVNCDGVNVWLNEGNKYAQPGTTGFQGCYAITLDGVSTRLLPDTRYRDKTKTIIDTTIQPDGFALVKITRTFWGNDYNAQKKIYVNMTPEEIRRHHQELAGGFSPAATPEGTFAINLEQYPGSINFAVSVPRFGRFQGGKLYFDALLSRPDFIKNGEAERTIPIAVNAYQYEEEEITHHLPKEYSIALALPQNALYQLPDSRCKTTIKCQHSGNTLQLKVINVRTPTLWNASVYHQLLEMNRKMKSGNNHIIIMTKPQ